MGHQEYNSEAKEWEPHPIFGGDTLSETAVKAPSPLPNLRSRASKYQVPSSSSSDPPYPQYPIPIPPEKQDRALELYDEFLAAELAEGFEQRENEYRVLSNPRSAASGSSTKEHRTPSLSTIRHELTEPSSVISFDGHEILQSELRTFGGKLVEKKRLTPKQRAKVALIRHLGSCWVCRKRGVLCLLEHYNITSLETLRQANCQRRLRNRQRLLSLKQADERYLEGLNQITPVSDNQPEKLVPFESSEYKEQTTAFRLPASVHDDKQPGNDSTLLRFDVEQTQEPSPNLRSEESPSEKAVSTTCGTKIKNILGISPRPISRGKTRVYWECVCGHRSYDDFVELQPGAAFRYNKAIQASSNDSGSTTPHAFSNLRTTISGLSSFLSLTKPQETTSLPLHERNTQQTSTNLKPDPQTLPPPKELVYLLVCCNEGRYGTRLLQLDLASLLATSDKTLFTILRESYLQMKGRWLAVFSLYTLTRIRFVKFEIYPSELVNVLKPDVHGHVDPDVLPSPGDGDYRYTPAPPDLIPPVGENHMLHLFQNPSHAKSDTICLSRFPKKLRAKIQSRSDALPGWGLQLKESWDIKKIWIIGFVIFGLGSLVFAIFWACFGGGVQDAFAVAAYMVAFATLTLGTLQVALLR